MGGIAGEPSEFVWVSRPGENGGVGASGRVEETSGRGVEPLDPVPAVLGPGVVCMDNSADFGVTPLPLPGGNLALLGVDLLIVGFRLSTVDGTVISAGVIASTQGLFEFSSALVVAGVLVLFLALLSFLLSRILFGSPLT